VNHDLEDLGFCNDNTWFAVIEFSKTILSIDILFGVLILGEENGVRGETETGKRLSIIILGTATTPAVTKKTTNSEEFSHY